MKHVLILALSALMASAACAQIPPAPPGDPAHPDTVIEFGDPETVIIVTDDREIAFSALIADTDPERSRGLMFRESLADDEAMLFNYEEVQPVSIWMRNTEIPLDILYIADDGTIRKIVMNAQPHSLRSMASDFPVLGVLEIRGGLSREAEIRPGHIVRHATFGNLDLPEPDSDDMPIEDAAIDSEPVETDGGE
ncbi:DUF192 domain-containing protein [Hyphobacterium sp.]|uniref:DUF192 domain-containing protein n=1 Tax=Hyphobacterium sp. TaxID=2004662 RepID=UPI003BA8FBBE